MASTPYPLPRETRESAVLAGNGTVGPYGPSLYKIFDTADVKVFAKALGETVFSDVTAGCTIAKVNPANAYDYFTVTFGALVPATTAWYHSGKRVAERSVAVTRGGTIDSNQLEKELSKQASAQSELRRDVGRAYSAQVGSGPHFISAGAASELMMADAAGNLVGSGSSIASILAATAGSAAAAAASAVTASAQAGIATAQAVAANGSAVAAAASAAAAAATLAASLLKAGGTMTGALLLAAGLVGTPGASFAGSPTTGLYAPAANTIGVSNAGVLTGVFDPSGRLVLGNAASIAMNIVASHPRLQVHGVDTDTTTIAQYRWQNTDTPGVQHYLCRAKSGAIGTHGLMADGAGIGSWIAAVSDGAKFIDATSIQAFADGAQALNSTPAGINVRVNQGGTATSVVLAFRSTGHILQGYAVAGVPVPGAAMAFGSTSNQTPLYQVHGLGTETQIVIARWSAGTGGATLGFYKSKGAAVGTRTIVASGDTIGAIQAYGEDGTNSPVGGHIRFVVDAAPGLASMPTRIEFGTTPTGSNVAVNHLVIDSRGFVAITGAFGTGAPVTKNADFTLADTENDIVVTKGSSCTATLPSAALWSGRTIWIKTTVAFTTVSASANVVPRIGGAAGNAILAAAAGSWARLVSDGANWIIMAGA